MAAGDKMRSIASKLNAHQRERLLHLDEHRRQGQRGATLHEELLELKLVERVASLTNPRMQSARLTTLGRNVAAMIRGAATLVASESATPTTTA
jgi:hypothetical protein